MCVREIGLNGAITEGREALPDVRLFGKTLVTRMDFARDPTRQPLRRAMAQ